MHVILAEPTLVTRVGATLPRLPSLQPGWLMWEIPLRSFSLLLGSAALLLSAASISFASPVNPGAAAVETQSGIEQVAGRCGPYRHWVPAHRWHGRFIHGYCARNHR